jgi:hypothetical protein
MFDGTDAVASLIDDHASFQSTDASTSIIDLQPKFFGAFDTVFVLVEGCASGANAVAKVVSCVSLSDGTGWNCRKYKFSLA